jgi:hypothetical protein
MLTMLPMVGWLWSSLLFTLCAAMSELARLVRQPLTATSRWVLGVAAVTTVLLPCVSFAPQAQFYLPVLLATVPLWAVSLFPLRLLTPDGQFRVRDVVSLLACSVLTVTMLALAIGLHSWPAALLVPIPVQGTLLFSLLVCV